MVNITVPIKPKDKFGITRSEPDQRQQQDDKGLNEIQWLQKLADEGRLIEQQETNAGSEVVNEIIIPNGSTFYLLEAKTTHNTTGDVNVNLIVNIGGAQSTVKSARVGPNTSQDLTVKGFSLIGNGIDFIAMDQLAGGSQTSFIFGYTQPSRTVSSRGNTM